MLQQASSSGVLANPRRLYRFPDWATSSATTDPRVSGLNKLRKLAENAQCIVQPRVR